MSTAKAAITIERDLLVRLDRLVENRSFPDRCRAVRGAKRRKVAQVDLRRLAEECEKLYRVSERKMADEGLSEEAALWPVY